MDVRPGYKLTEVGVIPDDWDVKRLGQLGGFLKGRGVTRAESATGNLACIRYGELYTRHNNHIKNFHSWISREVATTATRLEHGDILFAGSGETKEEIGKSAAFADDVEAYAGGDIVILRNKKADPLFLGYYLNTGPINKQKASKGQGDAIVHIGTEALASIQCALPHPSEQEAIADALTDADALVESLEQLLTKKRQIKKGAMQELLTGKKRLPGFSGEWQAKQLGEFSEIIMGQSPSSAHYNNKGEGLPLIQGNADISGRKTIARVFTTEVTKRGHAADILMSVRAPVGEICRTDFEVCLGRGVCAIRCSKNDFLYYALVSREPTWAKLSKGSTFDSISSADVEKFEIEQPADKTEQTAIATILSDMDAEIATRETKLAKARQLKQGMMQELLSGRIRLV